MIENLKKEHLNCNIFSVYDYDGMSINELLCQFFTKINECVDLSNNTIKLSEWLVNEGLSAEVSKNIERWLQDGTLNNIINRDIFNELNNKLDRHYTIAKPLPEVHFLGWSKMLGDCSIIKNEDGEYFMIDCGAIEEYKYLLDQITSMGINKIKYLFITHSHDDHIGCAVEFIERFKIEKVFLKSIDVNFRSFVDQDPVDQQPFHDRLINYCRTNNVELIEVTSQEIPISNHELIKPLGHDYSNKQNYNFESLMYLYKYKNTHVLFGGDCPRETQDFILGKHNLPRIDLFKACHHGNNDCMNRNLMMSVYPTNNVINCIDHLTHEFIKLSQFYELNCYSFAPGENKGSLSFIVGANGVATSGKRKILSNVWSNKTIDGIRDIYFKDGGLPARDEVIRYKNDYYYIGENYGMVRGDFIEKNKGEQTAYYYAGDDGVLYREKWFKYRNTENLCYAKNNLICAYNESLYIDGEKRYFDPNGMCTNPPSDI